MAVDRRRAGHNVQLLIHVTSIAARTSAFHEGTVEAPVPGHEYVRGWGVFALPFDSGHVLALRVVPQNSFAPYRTVWHRHPNGRWSIFVDAPRLDIACPRYVGAACGYTGHARIELSWTGPRTLRVSLDAPSLDWTLSVHTSPGAGRSEHARRSNAPATWRHTWLDRGTERMAQALGMGRLALSGEMPSGHVGKLMPQRMYYVDDAQATLDGLDLGRPTRLAENPKIGDLPLPARGVLVIGQGMWQIRDPEEFSRTRTAVMVRET